MSPQVPAMAKTTGMGGVSRGRMVRAAAHGDEIGGGVLDRPERTFSAVPRFFARRPVCRSQRSEAKERSRKTVVTTQPAMKSGFRPWAPMSEMYAMCWLALMEA